MKKEIWKYILEPNKLKHDVPVGGKILFVGNQFENIYVWIEVNSKPDALTEQRYFEIYGTGHPILYDMGIDRNYLGSVMLEGGAFVFHVFERVSK